MELQWFLDNGVSIIGILLFAVSEIVALNPKWKSNSVIQLILALLMKVLKKPTVGIVLLLSFALVACASTDWRKTAYDSYALAGTTLTECYKVGVQMEQSGYLKGEQLAKVKSYYKTARIAYREAGDILILASETEDAVKRKALVGQLDNVLIQVFQTAVNIQKIYLEVQK